MKSYVVDVVTVDEQGDEHRFNEIVEYPHIQQLTVAQYYDYGYLYPRSMRTVDEGEREAKAIAQVRTRNPHLRSVRALSSISIDL